MKGILIVSHGSRAAEPTETFKTIVSIVKNKMPSALIESASMEFSEWDIESGLTSLVKKGVTDIQVVPYFLFEGVHLQKDIPEIIQEFQKSNPNVSIHLKKALGIDERLADILIDRIDES